jgi:hypothetical protein
VRFIDESFFRKEGMIIANVRMIDGLYYLDNNSFSNKKG